MTSYGRIRGLLIAVVGVLVLVIIVTWLVGPTQVPRSVVSAEVASATHARQISWIARLQSGDGALLVPVMGAITFLGDEEFYLLAFPILYWALSPRLGLRLGAMLLVTASLNGLFKLVFLTPRPAFLDPGLELAHEGSFGTPSGHAQNAAAIWGLLATHLRRRSVRVGLLLLIVLIGWSRVHLGAHFVGDVFVGWVIGACLVVAFRWLEPRAGRWLREAQPMDVGLLATAISLAFIAPAVVLSSVAGSPAIDWPGAPDASHLAGASHVVTPAATLAGFGIGWSRLRARGGFDHSGGTVRRVLRVLMGLVGVVVIWEGLGMFFPSGEEPLALTLRYVRYALVGLWVGGLAPEVFVRVGLASRRGPQLAGDTR